MHFESFRMAFTLEGRGVEAHFTHDLINLRDD